MKRPFFQLLPVFVILSLFCVTGWMGTLAAAPAVPLIPAKTGSAAAAAHKKMTAKTPAANPLIPARPNTAIGSGQMTVRPPALNLPTSQPAGSPAVMGPWRAFEPSGAYYNQIPDTSFTFEVEDMQLLNGGLGNGEPTSYFCGRKDERDSYYKAKEDWDWTFGRGEETGDYQVLKMEDRCRTLGCNAPPDGKYYLWAMPKYATNCYPWGHAKVYSNRGGVDDPHYIRDQIDNPDDPERNYIGENDFRFGRHLFSIASKESLFPIAYHLGILLQDEKEKGYPYEPADPGFLDIPYSAAHLAFGFTCPFKGYNATILFYGRSGGTEGNLQKDVGIHYRALLEDARDRLAQNITKKVYGETPADTETVQTVSNIWAILKLMIQKLDVCESTRECTQRFLAEALGLLKSIEIRSCAVANGTTVEYQPEHSRICIDPPVSGDCHSRRAGNSDAHFNVDDCTPSYGELSHSDAQEAGGPGLYDTSRREREWYVTVVDDPPPSRPKITRRFATAPSLGGDSPAIASMIVHQLVHAYYITELKKEYMDHPDSAEALYEEELAVMAQAVVFSTLCDLGYCDRSFGMRWQEYYGSREGYPEARVRYFYEEPQGYGGLFLGPLYRDLFNIDAWLRRKDADMARFLANVFSSAPLLDRPEQSWVSGSLTHSVPSGTMGESLHAPGLLDTLERVSPGLMEAAPDSGGAQGPAFRQGQIGSRVAGVGLMDVNYPDITGDYERTSTTGTDYCSGLSATWNQLSISTGDATHPYKITFSDGTDIWLDGRYPDYNLAASEGAYLYGATITFTTPTTFRLRRAGESPCILGLFSNTLTGGSP